MEVGDLIAEWPRGALGSLPKRVLTLGRVLGWLGAVVEPASRAPIRKEKLDVFAEVFEIRLTSLSTAKLSCPGESGFPVARERAAQFLAEAVSLAVLACVDDDDEAIGIQISQRHAHRV